MQIIRTIVVDTSHIFIEAVVRLLFGYSQTEIVGRAYSSQEALEKIKTLQPDLVLLELNMPEMSGLEVTRLLKARPDAPRVIMMAFHDIPAYQAHAQEAEADAYILKSELGVGLIPLIETLFPDAASGPAET